MLFSVCVVLAIYIGFHLVLTTSLYAERVAFSVFLYEIVLGPQVVQLLEC